MVPTDSACQQLSKQAWRSLLLESRSARTQSGRSTDGHHDPEFTRSGLFVLGLGYFAGLWKMVDNKNVHSINVMLMNFALPCALFLAIARTSSKVLERQYRLVVALALAMILIYALTRYCRARCSTSSQTKPPFNL